MIRRLIRDNLRHYWGRLVLALLCMGVVSATTALSAYLMEPVVNDVFIAEREDMLWWVSGAVFATFLAKGFASYGQSLLMAFVGLRIIADNQTRLYRHLIGMDLGFFNSMPSGRLVSRFLVDINHMRVAVSNALTGFGKDLLSLVGLVTVMFVQDWQLAFIAFFVFPIAVYPIVRLGKRMRKVTANTQEETGLFSAILDQSFQGIRVVKAYGMEDYETSRVSKLVERIFTLTIKSARIRALSSPIMETLGGCAVAVVIVYGGYRVIHQNLDPGSFFSFITALLLAYEPMKRLANLNASLQEGLAGAQRLFDLLDTEPGITESPNAKPLATPAQGAIELADVEFSYIEGQPALEHVTMSVPAGKTVALVGPSGAGKSTILNLIPRFYDINAGTITIDGTDVRDATLESLYANISLVSQEVTLFDDTVRANIAYGKPGATDAEIEDAARHAAALEFINDLPEGFETQVGERGVKLSGGQRQRLAIARAILKNAPILLLDEATSSLDTESERHVQEALDHLMQGRTTLVIAHRLSTIVGADLIYVIQNGTIVETGSHRELVEKGGAYEKLYALQFAAEAETQAKAGTG
ncbi:MAG: ABC transporter ATP-binding protein [Rhodospirillales bacterium]|nr:ABC transporter ATP-binding protein [Rhodospirillales bacterium]MBO6788550.1 ABC transporter ATP-binding protein [Rhodospirillales bacterium]